MKKTLLLVLSLLNAVLAAEPLASSAASSDNCGTSGPWLQVLGSGGPELDDGRASTGYLLWVDGRARVLIDAGAGVAANFERSGASFADLDAIALTHLHVDHSADLPALLKGSYFTDRRRSLTVYGPDGNRLMPSTSVFVQRLFADGEGAFGYLGDFLATDERPADFKLDGQVAGATTHVVSTNGVTLRSVPVTHGPIPALAWRLDVAGKSALISGDMAGADDRFRQLLQDVDLFVAHHAVPESASGVARRLHMPPSVIGQFAAGGKVDRVLLSHLMKRTLRSLRTGRQAVAEHYSGPIGVAHDMACYPL